MVRSNFRAWFRGKRGWAVDGGTRVRRPSLCCQGTAKSTLFFSASFVSSHFHPNQTSISNLILISQLPQPIIISPVCAPECLLWVFFFFPPLFPHSWSFFPVILFLQQSISLFNLMLFSCLSRLCVWFSFSWRLAGKRAGFYPKILFLKKKKKEKKNMTTLVFSPGKV